MCIRDSIKREVAFTAEMGGKYMLVCPAAVGRPGKYDDSEIARSIDSLSRVADLFVQYGVRAAIEPIRAEMCIRDRLYRPCTPGLLPCLP